MSSQDAFNHNNLDLEIQIFRIEFINSDPPTLRESLFVDSSHHIFLLLAVVVVALT